MLYIVYRKYKFLCLSKIKKSKCLTLKKENQLPPIVIRKKSLTMINSDDKTSG